MHFKWLGNREPCYTRHYYSQYLHLLERTTISKMRKHNWWKKDSYSLRILSLPPETTRWETGLQSTAKIDGNLHRHVQGDPCAVSCFHTPHFSRKLDKLKQISKNKDMKVPFSVESALPLTNKRESADQAIWYTAWTCPRSVVMNDPVFPSQILIDLSKDADAINRESGENFTSFTNCWWPIMRAETIKIDELCF